MNQELDNKLAKMIEDQASYLIKFAQNLREHRPTLGSAEAEIDFRIQSLKEIKKMLK